METVHYRREDRIAWITLDRPRAHNAIDDALRLKALHGYSGFGSGEALPHRGGAPHQGARP